MQTLKLPLLIVLSLFLYTELHATSWKRWGTTGGYSCNPIAGFAGFLWHVYDGYEPSNFKSTWYGSLNNDDVAEPDLLIQTIESLTTSSFLGAYSRTGLRDALEAGVSPDWPTKSEEALSIDKIYNCMMAPDPTGDELPVFPPMRPAQINNLVGGIAYANTFDLTAYHVNVSWDPRQYTSGSYANPPSGYHVYTQNGSSWSLSATVGADQTSANFTVHSAAATVAVSAFNSTSGDSYDPPSISVSTNSGPGNAGKPAVPYIDADVSQLGIATAPSENNNISVAISGLLSSEPVVIELLNSIGGTVKVINRDEPPLNSNVNLVLDCSNLGSGMYLIRVTQSARSAVRRITLVK